MNSKFTILFALVFLALGVSVADFIRSGLAIQRDTHANQEQAARQNAEIEKLNEQCKKFDGLVPDQAAIMTHVGYHFTNLWFAVDQENWPLADFYLGETRANVKWAVRSKPFRKGPNGENIDLGAIAQSVDNTNFTGLKKYIDSKQKPEFAALHKETLAACYSCHKASGKPYLRPHVPENPEARIINMDPAAQTPQ